MAAITTLFHSVSTGLSFILKLLPDSPFGDFISNAITPYTEYIGYLNYFMPVESLVNITTVWVTCITGFYIYKAARNAISK